MDRTLPLALAVGVAVGVATDALLLPNWIVAYGTAATYAGLAYFWLAHPEARRGIRRSRLSDRVDRLGYVFGAVGVSAGPLGFLSALHATDAQTVAFLVWYTGTLAFVFVVWHVRGAERQSVAAARAVGADLGE